MVHAFSVNIIRIGSNFVCKKLSDWKSRQFSELSEHYKPYQYHSGFDDTSVPMIY